MTDYTDFYSTIDAGIKERLRYALQSDFLIDKLDLKVSSNESNLNRGFDYFILTKPGPFPPVQFAQSKEIQDVDWNTKVELYVRYNQKDEQWSRFTQFRDAVIWHLWKYRFLGSVTINAQPIAEVPYVDSIRNISASGEAEYFVTNGTNVNFMTQPINVTTRQRVRFV
jgi:hypothetical protein